MLAKLQRFRRDEAGQGLPEYALLVAGVVVMAVGSSALYSPQIQNQFRDVGRYVESSAVGLFAGGQGSGTPPTTSPPPGGANGGGNAGGNGNGNAGGNGNGNGNGGGNGNGNAGGNGNGGNGNGGGNNCKKNC